MRAAKGAALALAGTLVLAGACGRSSRVIGGGSPATPSSDGGASGAGNEGGSAPSGTSGASGGGASGGDDGTTTRAELEACLYFVRAVCNKVFFECNGAPNSTSPCPPSTDSTCPDRYFLPGSTADVKTLIACANDWTLASCDDIKSGRRPDCLPRGLEDDGAACVFGAQCASGYCAASTNPDGSPGCGACVPLAKEGEDCSSGKVHCFEGLVCQGGTCVPGPAFGLSPGAPCDRLGSCASGYYCLELTGDAAPRCQLAPAVGEACPLDTPYCDGNCNTDGLCVAAPRKGAPCALGGSDAHICELGLRCDLGAAGGPTCVPPLPLGAACTPLNADFSSGGCEKGALCHCDDTACESGTCVKRRDLGDSCGGAHDVCIAGTRCESGLCESAGPQGLFTLWCTG